MTTIERRTKVRYPLELNVRYQTLDVSAPIAGAGYTVNMSSNGLLVACHTDLKEGARLKLTIEWPSLLNGNTPLQLVMVGMVVRCTESNFAVAYETYQFRTMSRKTNQPSATATMPAIGRVAVGGTGIATGHAGVPAPQGRGLARSLSLVPAKS